MKTIEMAVDKFASMETARRVYEPVWQEIRELVRPNTQDINRTTPEGDVRTAQAFDGTAIDACGELANGLHSYLTNPTERWFGLHIAGFEPHHYDEESLAWLEVVADSIYAAYSDERSGFNAAMHEGYLDIAAFGTSGIYQEWSWEQQTLLFRTCALASIYVLENHFGIVDTVARKTCMTKRQLEAAFKSLPKELATRLEREKDGSYEIVHLVCPRGDRDMGKLDAANKPFASIWISWSTKEIIEQGGYDELPYHVARWLKIPDEVYGVGPAKNCLPDIRVLNAMERTNLKAGAKIVEPPLMVPSESFLAPVETSPGALIYREPGGEPIEPLLIKGNLPWGMEQAEQKRAHIRKAFHSDWLRLEKENKEMTAFEVADRRNEKLQLLAPMMGRVQGEQLGPIIRRSYAIKQRLGHFPPAPASLSRKKLQVVYVSPAARAQFAVKANEMGRYAQELVPVAQIKPEVLDIIDFDKFARKLAEFRGLTRTIMRTEGEMQSMRQRRQEQEDMAVATQAAESASVALKNVAAAKAQGVNLPL